MNGWKLHFTSRFFCVSYFVYFLYLFVQIWLEAELSSFVCSIYVKIVLLHFFEIDFVWWHPVCDRNMVFPRKRPWTKNELEHL